MSYKNLHSVERFQKNFDETFHDSNPMHKLKSLGNDILLSYKRLLIAFLVIIIIVSVVIYKCKISKLHENHNGARKIRKRKFFKYVLYTSVVLFIILLLLTLKIKPLKQLMFNKECDVCKG